MEEDMEDKYSGSRGSLERQRRTVGDLRFEDGVVKMLGGVCKKDKTQK